MLVGNLPKILTPLDNIEIVEIFLSPKTNYSNIISVVPILIWNFDEITPYMDLPKDPDSVLYQRCEWTIVSSKEISPIVDETLYEEKSDTMRTNDISQDVYNTEYTHEQVINLYVKQEFPAAVSFIQRFESWLKDHLLDITQHLLNTNKQTENSENFAVSLTKIEKNEENIENDCMKAIQCVFCKEFGEKRFSGRLLPCDEHTWVHSNCAYWSSEVRLDEHGNLINFHLSLSRSKKTVIFIQKCKECNKIGATLNCVAKKCHNSFHFPCAITGKVFLLETRGVLCENCNPPKEQIKSISFEALANLNFRKLIIPRSKKNSKKPNFVIGQFNRIGSLILYDISLEKFCSYRLG